MILAIAHLIAKLGTGAELERTLRGGRTRNASERIVVSVGSGTLIAACLTIAAPGCTPQTKSTPATSGAVAVGGTPTMQDDLAHRSPEIHWPQGFNPSEADLFAHNELVVHVPCDRVWGHIADATRWPEWYPNSKNVRILSGGDTTLTAASVFSWATFGLQIESRVNEFVPVTRLSWFGYAPGQKPAFYHTWYLAPEGGGCLVVTEEVGRGEGAAKFRAADEGGLHRGHDLWLATLRWVAERP